ncbi:acyl-CoA dehydrogenase family protein [Bacillus wiedmannii]|uniref:acyl-CoA dehydrogenase family protein n=1 Tax=Bacillus wiedmannii TaxID=1890302 RepID=UPI000BF24097|nr:acyl-CoA dehydrogenase family protein [Bacillus wiedmannii]PEL51881.1 acyl-CoA dehydrogenase [Bacillus wiedmannii]PEO05020.1 acyl-CoA dehydrogenase [Bacillus wiedmannii]PEP98154.1 acyl-CoA dehydrogenase [Bacillus wiedmannii]
MRLELTNEQLTVKKKAREYVDTHILPYAEEFDRNQEIPKNVIRSLAEKGYLTPMVPKAMGGLGLDLISIGCLNEEIGKGCSSIRSLMTVHGMVTLAVMKWGTEEQKQYWIPQLVSGRKIASFCLSEASAGSDIKSIETKATISDAGSIIISGRKKWITFGQIADIFLVFAQCDNGSVAVLVERDTPGLSVKPIRDILGVRGSMIAEVHMNECKVPKENIIGGMGMGLSSVAVNCLEYGRYTVAWGCVGSAQACLDSSVNYTKHRKQFDSFLKDNQLIQKIITNMVVNVKASRMLCLNAGYLKESGDPKAIMETWIAKYFSARTLSSVSSDAIQIHGANGIISDNAVQRHYRDSKIMEIIEGTTQMHEIQIGSNAHRIFTE